MIEGHDILCFAPGPWDDIWRNRHQIMTRLARANKILYIEPWLELRPMLRCLRRGELSLGDIRGPRLNIVGQNLYVYQPPLWAPRAARFPLNVLTEAIYMASLRQVLRRLQFQQPILWLFLPDTEIFIGRFHEKLVIYHIVDEYAGYSGISASWRPVLERMEQRLARKADLVFVTSPTLLERKRELNERVFLVPNAVDYEMFAAVANDPDATPADMMDIPKPIIGYIGAINDKIDVGLLAQVARTHSDWSLVLVGPVAIKDEESLQTLHALQALPNVYLLGRKAVEEVPRYIVACDVCLLPYRINEWTKNIDSLKLYEYLACAKPVVATNVPAAQRFSHVVKVAANEIEFISSINSAWKENSPALQAERQHIAAQNTWEQRVDQLSVAIEARLKERQIR
ncbi:MAG: glycosyltransferase [Anaerolineae bacterium]